MTAIGRKYISRRALGLAILAVVYGCSPSTDMRGHWLGYQKLQARPGADPAIVRTLSKVDLVVDGRGKFSLFLNGLPYKGTVQSSEGGATLSIESVLGNKTERPNPTVKAEGKDALLFVDPSAPVEVRLARQAPQP